MADQMQWTNALSTRPSLEAAIFLCSAFLGLGAEAFVCFCETEIPWVVTLHKLEKEKLEKNRAEGTDIRPDPQRIR